MKDRIKLIRHTLGLTQQKFADRLGIKGNAISQYESGRNAPIDAVISLICREFSVSEAWLRTGEGEMFVPKEDDALDELAKQYDLSSGDLVLIEKFLKLKPAERQAVITYMQNIVSTLNAAPLVDAKLATTTPVPDADKDIPVPATTPDIAAELAELKRQNEELAAEIAAMKEEDALYRPIGTSEASSSASAGSLSQRAKK